MDEKQNAFQINREDNVATALTPLVIAGGTAMYNAEPIADFVDLVSLGEGEDLTVELVELHRQARREGWSKEEFLRAAARLPGIYVPSLYDVTYHDDGTVAAILESYGVDAQAALAGLIHGQ